MRQQMTRSARLARLSNRNRAALALLHTAAQAISDDDADYAEACMAEAAGRLQPSRQLPQKVATIAQKLLRALHAPGLGVAARADGGQRSAAV
jgi:hypothetical protein